MQEVGCYGGWTHNHFLGRCWSLQPCHSFQTKLTSYQNVTACDCYWGLNLQNFIKIGSRVWPPDARNCWMFNARLLGNGHCDGSYIMADMWTWWNATTRISSKSVYWEASYGISNRLIFQHSGRPQFCILKILIFDHVTVIVVLICCCVPNFIKLVHAFGFQTPITAECLMRRC